MNFVDSSVGSGGGERSVGEGDVEDGEGSRGEAVAAGGRWQDALADISLSGFSDIIVNSHNPDNMHDMMEFVRRQISSGGGTPRPESAQENYFQFLLMAPTSPAVPINQESLTYLNQDQSYEVRLKVAESSSYPSQSENFLRCFLSQSQLLTSVLRLSFHDRRQINNERSLWAEWRRSHVGQKLLAPERSLSANVEDVKQDAFGTFVRFDWSPAKVAKISLRVNCMSTEFTTKKHGGEKGVPFRLTLETFRSTGEGSQKLPIHSAYTQIRVFTAKGADRKNKTDRIKAEKRVDKEKFQPAYDYTVFTEAYPTDFAEDGSHLEGSSDSMCTPESRKDAGSETPQITEQAAGTSLKSQEPYDHIPLVKWRKPVSVNDLMVLTREECTQILGMSSGIRLFNTLHPRPVRACLTLLLRREDTEQFSAVFLMTLSVEELRGKLGDFLGIGMEDLCQPLLWQVRQGVTAIINDEVIKQMDQYASFTVRTEESDSGTIAILKG